MFLKIFVISINSMFGNFTANIKTLNFLMSNNSILCDRSKLRKQKSRNTETLSEEDATTKCPHKEIKREVAGGGDNILTFPKKKSQESKSENCLYGILQKNKSPTLVRTTPSPLKMVEALQKSANSCNYTHEVKVGYRNVNFANSQSDIEEDSPKLGIITSINKKTSKIICKERTDVDFTCKISQRPIICPEAECSRMVAIDSLASHFYFDHSKLTMVNLQRSKMESVVLNIETLPYGTNRCIAYFLVPDKTKLSSTSIYPVNSSISMWMDRHKSSLTLPLVASRVPFRLPSRYSCDLYESHEQPNRTSWKYDHSVRAQEKSKEERISRFMDSEEVLLLWLCGLDKITLTYSITLIGSDPQLSYSYSGRVYSMREPQDGASVLQQADCLVVPGTAVNRLQGNPTTELLVNVVLH